MPPKKTPALRAATARVEVPLVELLDGASMDEARPDMYSNHVQIILSTHEMMLDFYTIGPGHRSNKHLKATFTQRIILPIAMAKGLATAVANAVANHEENTKETLPNSRTPSEDDKVAIWT